MVGGPTVYAGGTQFGGGAVAAGGGGAMVGGGGVAAGGAGGGRGGAACGCGRGDGCEACGVACGITTPDAKLGFVGGGRGSYIQETTYKYVGAGCGELEYITAPKQPNYCICIGGVVGLILVPLLLWLLF